MFKFLPRTMNGIFAIEKPSGVTSSSLVLDIQHRFTSSQVFAQELADAKNTVREQLGQDRKWNPSKIENRVKKLKIKVGHGGTLDPLARGVVVIGVGSGTKQLQHYLTQCRKTYETKALLGLSTTTGDSEGEILTQNPIDHITKEQIDKTAIKFIGDLKQTPPIFSALKMNGKPLYDYAREGKPLPQPIKPREVKVFDFKVHSEDSLKTDHSFEKLESKKDENGNPIEHLLANNPTLNDSPLHFSEQFLSNPEISDEEKKINKPVLLSEGQSLPEILPLIHLTADVSSGTYIRSLISDFGRALDSSAYMVELIRTKQSNWELGKNVFTLDMFEADERVWGPILKKVLDNGHEVDVPAEFEQLSDKVRPLIEHERKLTSETEEGSSKDQSKGDAKILYTKESDDVNDKDETGSPDVPKKRSIDQVEN